MKIERVFMMVEGFKFYELIATMLDYGELTTVVSIEIAKSGCRIF